MSPSVLAAGSPPNTTVAATANVDTTDSMPEAASRQRGDMAQLRDKVQLDPKSPGSSLQRVLFFFKISCRHSGNICGWKREGDGAAKWKKQGIYIKFHFSVYNRYHFHSLMHLSLLLFSLLILTVCKSLKPNQRVDKICICLFFLPLWTDVFCQHWQWWGHKCFLLRFTAC